jgi:dTDP-4-dehydrorhamnose 3,5-epimerase
MEEGWQATAIEGVLRRTLARHEDARGMLREAWRASWTQALGIGPISQANHTISRAGSLRGLHFHLRQTDVWVLLDGRAHVGLLDIRGVLAGPSDVLPTINLVLQSGDCLVIPVGVAHGMWALSDVSLLYLVSSEYDGSDENGFAWNDRMANVRWPEGTPTLSGRDATAPPLADALVAARRVR